MTMTTREIRETLERFIDNGNPDDTLREALNTAINGLPPEDTDIKPSAKARLAAMERAIMDARQGWTPLNRSRDNLSATWRQALMTRLRDEGYTLHQIGDAIGKDHTTVLYGVRRLHDGMEVKDPLTTRVWGELMTILLEIRE